MNNKKKQFHAKSVTETDERSTAYNLLAEYRFDRYFIISYALLFVGLILFDWDPHYVFLGLAIEILIFSIGSQLQALTASGIRAFIIALIFSCPAFLLILFISVIPPLIIITEGAGETWSWEGLGIIIFLISSLYSSFQRFCRTTLKSARFYCYMNRKYVFEDGKPLFSGFSLIIGSLCCTWIATITFLVSLGIASLAGTFTPSSAVIMTILCLLSRMANMAIIGIATQRNSNMESLCLENLKEIGEVQLR